MEAQTINNPTVVELIRLIRSVRRMQRDKRNSRKINDEKLAREEAAIDRILSFYFPEKEDPRQAALFIEE